MKTLRVSEEANDPINQLMGIEEQKPFGFNFGDKQRKINLGSIANDNQNI